MWKVRERVYIKNVVLGGTLLLTVLCNLVIAKGGGMFSHVELARLILAIPAFIPALITVVIYYVMHSLVIHKWSIKCFFYVYLTVISVTVPATLISMAIDVRTINWENIIKSFFPFLFPNYFYLGIFLFAILFVPMLKKINYRVNNQIKNGILFFSFCVGTLAGFALLNHPSVSFLIWIIIAIANPLIEVSVKQKKYLYSASIAGLLVLLVVGTISSVPYRVSLINNLAPMFMLILGKALSNTDEYSEDRKKINSLFLLPLALIFTNPLLLNLCRDFFVRYFRPVPVGWFLFFAISFVSFLFLYGYCFAVSGYINDLLESRASVKGAVPLIVSAVLLMYMIYNYSEFYALGFDAMIKQQNGRIYLAFLNLLLVVLWYFVVSTIINRFWISTTLFCSVMIGFSFANVQKIQYRNEPIIYPDLAMVKSLPEIVKMVNVQLVILMLIVILGLLVLSFFLQKKFLKGKLFKIVPRILVLSLSGILLWQFSVVENQMNLNAWLNKKNDTSNPISNMIVTAGYTAHPENLGHNAQAYGPALVFTSTQIIKTMDRPARYSRATVNKVVSKYERLATRINKTRRNNNLNKQTVIYILSESYADPRRVPSVKLSSDPIPYMESLKSKNTSGLMFSSGYGGGTANIEFEALTSLSMNNFDPSLVTPYVFLVPRVNNLPVITDLFAHKNAIHPYQSTTYDRGKVFKKFGFQTFHTLDNKNIEYKSKLGKSEYVDDQSAFEQTIKQIHSVKGGQFIQLSTMQNHMPYIKGTYEQNDFNVKANLYSYSINQIESYTQGIHYTDAALKKFISKVDKMKKHVTIVFYGDHLPGIYSGNAVSGKNAATVQGKLHQTDYFIHSNFATHGIKNTNVVSPNMFTPMVMEKLNEKVSPYYALLTAVQQKVPAAELNKYMKKNGQLIVKKNLSKKAKIILRDYKLIQYDITAGKQYSLKTKNFVK
ncbi:hypothetical protein PESHB5_03670 [Pediococcus parvulus]